MPGPASVTLTLPAAARAAATDGLSGVEDEAEAVSTNLTAIVEPDFVSVVLGSGEMKRPRP